MTDCTINSNIIATCTNSLVVFYHALYRQWQLITDSLSTFVLCFNVIAHMRPYRTGDKINRDGYR